MKEIIDRRAFLQGAGLVLGAPWLLKIEKDAAVFTENHEWLSNELVWHLPYLPATQAESVAHVNGLSAYENGQKKWDRLVLPRVFMGSGDSLKGTRYEGRLEAVNAYARQKGWINNGESYSSHDQVFAYPSTVLVSDEDLRAGKNKKFWLTGREVEVDAVQLSSYSVAVAPIDKVNTVLFSNPGEFGMLHARLLDGYMHGEISMAFARNRHVDTLSSTSEVPAIHIDGNPGAPVRITVLMPNADSVSTEGAKMDMTVFERNLSDAGDLVVHLPGDPSLYQDEYAPVVQIQLAVEASTLHGETEIFFRIGSDDFSPGKNRLTVAEMLMGNEKA